VTITLSKHSRVTAGVLLLALAAVEFGGYYLTSVVRGDVALTELQENFARAGHAHAGVLVTLGLVGLILADAARLRGVWGVLGRHGIPAGALLISLGFFLSSTGEGTTSPNGLIVLLWLGAASLSVGLLTLGVALIVGPRGEHVPQPGSAGEDDLAELRR